MGALGRDEGVAGTQQRKMVDIEVVETSAVDYPAHLRKGWIVCKSADAKDVETLFGVLDTKKGTTVAETKTTAVEDLEKGEAPTVESLTATITLLKEELAKAQAAKPAEEQQEDVLKGLPEAVREMLSKAAAETEQLRKEAAEDREKFEKSENLRLDTEAVRKSEGMFKALGINHTEVAPALRRVELSNPELAKSLTDALKAADAQLETAGIFKTAGRNGGETDGNGAVAKLHGIAAELQKADPTLTAQVAFTKALEANPDLYTESKREGK